MKTLFRIAVVLFILLLVTLVGGYLTLTNAGFQKRLVERQLPEGSSIESIHVTTTQVTLSGLLLILPDGTRVQVSAVDTAFDPLAAVFDQTIKMGVLQVEGLRVDLPVVAEPKPSGRPSVDVRVPRVEAVPDLATASEPAANPLEALYALGDFKWLLDIEGIAVEGVIHDGNGSMYMVRVDSPAIRPGEVSKIDASLQLLTDVFLPSGLESFDSTVALSFKQKVAGGFESLKLETNTSGKDFQGLHLISLQQKLDLEVDDAEATISVTFDADLPKPQVLVPELAGLGALKVSGNAVVSTDGEAMTLSTADLNISAAGSELLALDLKRSLVFGGVANVSGEFLDITITALQLEWLNAWLGDGLRVQSQAPVSLELSVVGVADGAFAVKFAEPIALGPLTVTEAGVPLLQDLVVIVALELQLSVDQLLTYSLDSLSVADKYGSFIQGSSNGMIQLDASRTAANPFAGVQTQTELQISLQEVFQLPVLAGSASIVSGQLGMNLSIDEAAVEPLQLQAKVKGLRARSLPSVSRDYVIALGLKPTLNKCEWKIGADMSAGPVSRPSTVLRFSSIVNASQEPMTFDAELSGPRVTQKDISILTAAFSPREETGAAPYTPTLPGQARSSAPKTSATPRIRAAVASRPVPPAWAMLSGDVSVSIDEFRVEAGQVIEAISLKAVVSEPKLSVDPISAKIGKGKLSGSSTVLYASNQLKPYSLTTDIRFEEVDPAFFAKNYQRPPVQGQFDGVFEVAGVGETLNTAIEDSTAALKITGGGGVLTAFELDERKQLGLGLAGLLGQSLDRPGITALSLTIPYFKNIPFDHFVFELMRGTDKRVLIPELRLTGESVLLDASGSVGASNLSDVMNQPLDLIVSLGAKGRLTEYLETLDLLQSTAGEDGFTRWNQEIKITGSLADPDTGALMDILNDAAKGALSKPKKREHASEETDPTNQLSTKLAPQSEGAIEASEAEGLQNKSKEERRRDDIEMGLDLLNSFFGN
ncbi:MAG: hypothetical protein P8P52_01825 [Opitutae bacterium]|nr:hypothetical protein [Opitutae bacterium]